MSSFLDKMHILFSRTYLSSCTLPVLLSIVPRMPTGFSLLPKDCSRDLATSWSVKLVVEGTNGSSCPSSPRSGCHFLQGVRIVVLAFPPNGSLGRRSSRFCNSGECLAAKFVVQISVVLCCERSLRESPLEEFQPASLVLTIGRNPVPRVHGVIICRTGENWDTVGEQLLRHPRGLRVTATCIMLELEPDRRALVRKGRYLPGDLIHGQRTTGTGLATPRSWA